MGVGVGVGRVLGRRRERNFETRRKDFDGWDGWMGRDEKTRDGHGDGEEFV